MIKIHKSKRSRILIFDPRQPPFLLEVLNLYPLFYSPITHLSNGSIKQWQLCMIRLSVGTQIIHYAHTDLLPPSIF